MEKHERLFLEDTRDILIGYDGYNTVEGLKALIDETRERLTKLLNGEIKPDDVGLIK
ncbi:hypothetical protein [Brevibacillus gelatini]|uniref:hypothetical protein n=1 Tax=Brevibacillus gelatini TaxID=1655277 RepID=UPI001475A907|nr:hypothetical protein [Brevibacillus gelatini]